MTQLAQGERRRIGLMAHQFLINIGANDFLKNLIRGLASQPAYELVFLCPRANHVVEERIAQPVRSVLGVVPGLKRSIRYGLRLAAPVAEKALRKPLDAAYRYYLEACPGMQIARCDETEAALRQAMTEHRLDVIFPSIHVLPSDLPHVNYWPDCQPKHFPEFFDEASQKVRDGRIRGLLSSGRPMIINSQHAKRDMSQFYGARPEQIFDLPFAPIIEIEKLTPRPELALKYSVRPPYFIVSNQFWIHKSLETVITAARHLADKNVDVRIVFTGRMEEPRKPGYIEGLSQLVNDLGVRDRIIFTGYIPKDDQIELMKQAVAVVQPTLFEGGPGGGSVYDAVSLGMRSIVSNIEINRELPQRPEQLFYFKVRDSEDLAERMIELLERSYLPVSIEDLYQQSKSATLALGKRLAEAIEMSLK